MDYLIGLLPAIITGMFCYYMQRAQKMRDDAKEKEAQEKEKEKAEKERLKGESLKVLQEMVEAAMELSYATAMAWKNGKPNGEVEKGIEFYNKAKADTEQYDRELKSKILA